MGSGAVRSRGIPRIGVTKSGGKQFTYIATDYSQLALRLLGVLLSQCQAET